MFTIDTNILVYSADCRDPQKQAVAGQVIAAQLRQGNFLPLQTLTEFFFVMTKKRLIDTSEAFAIVSKMMAACPTVSADSDDVLQAIELHQGDRVPFFDALLLFTAARSGCTTIFSEDFQHNRTYGSITVRNPFLMTLTEIDSLLQ